jgi:probable rRNA maturation factor
VIDVDVQDAVGAAGAPDERFMVSWIRFAMARHPDTGPAELCLRIVDEDESRQLNRDYRGKDRPTNVLSFVALDAIRPPEGPAYLGDIVICGPVVEREAAGQGKAVADHWAHLLVHGTLHLLGYDHESEREARVMEALETSILGEHGIADPYAA